LTNKNYIPNIFNKSRDELSISDLKDFFELPQEETSTLEFKSGKVEIIDLYKEITAFLNTEGGLLIVGSPIETKQRIGKNYKTTCQGELTYTKFKNKDWLYQKITSNIVPAPTDIKIVEFLEKNGTIFMLDIPQSMNPPHQCSADGKYYIRLEREAKPAPHGIIEALFNKRKIPKLKVRIQIKKINEHLDELELLLNNVTNVPAEKVSYTVDLINVGKVESEFDFEYLISDIGEKFTMSHHHNSILPEILSLKTNAVVNHFKEEYIVFVAFWCKDVNFDFQFWTYNPLSYEFTSLGSKTENGMKFLEDAKRLKK